LWMKERRMKRFFMVIRIDEGLKLKVKRINN